MGIGECESVFSIVKVKEGVKKVACGENHTMILMNDNSIWTCGSNDKYQLGH